MFSREECKEISKEYKSYQQYLKNYCLDKIEKKEEYYKCVEKYKQSYIVFHLCQALYPL